MLKIYCTLLFVAASLFAVGQTKVCENKESVVIDLNTIRKCAADEDVKEGNKNTKQVTTRNRLVRNRNTSRISELKRTLDVHERIKNHTFPIKEVDRTPLFQGCIVITSRNEQLNCFNMQLEEHIAENLKYPKKALKNGLEDEVFVSFTIGANGDVRMISTTSVKKHKVLEKEAERIIEKLPKLIPAMKNGQAIAVHHKVRVSFDLQTVNN